MVKDISHICFTNLSVLSLMGNEIDSIEGLTRLEIACIRDINISTIDGMKAKTTSGALES
jgi:hypothetical protein